jgi:hypothetical protein
MAVVSVREQHQRRRSGWRDGKETHTRVWIVITDDPTDGPRVAMAADDGTQRIPAPRESLTGPDPYVRVSSIGGRAHQGKRPAL